MNLSEPPERVKAYVAKMKLTFPIVIDGSGEVARTYQVQFTPTHFLIDRSGAVRAGGSGSKDWNSHEARTAVQVLLEAPVRKTSEPARQHRAESPPTGRTERR